MTISFLYRLHGSTIMFLSSLMIITASWNITVIIQRLWFGSHHIFLTCLDRIIFGLQVRDYKAVHCIRYTRFENQNNSYKLCNITTHITAIFVAVSRRSAEVLINSLLFSCQLPAFSIQEGLRFINLCVRACCVAPRRLSLLQGYFFSRSEFLGTCSIKWVWKSSGTLARCIPLEQCFSNFFHRGTPNITVHILSNPCLWTLKKLDDCLCTDYFNISNCQTKIFALFQGIFTIFCGIS